ncbi:MAG: hypothetical protein Q9182_006739 [Xanthomendoza sp. 2 TL-2023]
MATGLSDASKAGIGVGVAFAVFVVCGILYLLYRRKRRARQLQPFNNDNAVDQLKPGSTEPQVTELRDDGKSLDPPPAYPYGKTAPQLATGSLPDSNLQNPSESESRDQPIFPSTDSSKGSNANFYPQSSKQHQHEISHPTQHNPNNTIPPLPHPPEIDGTSLHEAPASPPQPTDGVPSTKPSSYGTDPDHLSKLEQEERRLQDDIAQIERLEQLKAERDEVRRKIREMSQMQAI